MLTKAQWQLCALATVLAAIGAINGVARSNATDTTLHDIAGYRQWTRVTTKPQPVENSIDTG